MWVKFYRATGLDKAATFLLLLPQLRTCLGVAARFTLSAISRREQVQQHLCVQKLVARGREHDRLWSTSRVWPQGPLGCPKPRWHRLCARRDSAASSGKWSVRPSAQRYSIVRLPPSLQPELAQPPNESVGRLALSQRRSCGPATQRCVPDESAYASTVSKILPICWLDSMSRCAAATSASGNVRSITVRIDPASIKGQAFSSPSGRSPPCQRPSAPAMSNR